MARARVPKIATVRLGSTTYRLPFADLFRPHTSSELARLDASIARHGVRQRVLTATIAGIGQRCVIDGIGRLTIAAKRGLSVPVQDLGPQLLDLCRELALTLNADRRHLTLEEQQAARASRIERVVEATEAGRSTREIAAAEGVSQMQVLRDQAASVGLQTDTGVSPPSRPPERLLQDARRERGRLVGRLDALLESTWAPRLRALLDRHRADATLTAVGAALADLEAEAAMGFDTEGEV